MNSPGKWDATLTELIARFRDDENANVQDVLSEAHEAREEMIRESE